MTAETQGTLEDLAKTLRDNTNLEEKYKKVQLIYADNGVGKTRLSMAFRDLGRKMEGNVTVDRDTLYYNAYTEDLFRWNNKFDSEKYEPPVLEFDPKSHFFDGLKDESRRKDIEEQLRHHLKRYASFRFKINYKTDTDDVGEIHFFHDAAPNVKISRGEERLFVWCFFLAIMKMAIEGEEAYNWVNYIYIDDPISSLDDNNAISVACDLKEMLKGKGKPKFVISTHHALFFDVLCNEFDKNRSKDKDTGKYRMVNRGYALKPLNQEKPFFQHLEVLKVLYQTQKAGTLRRYHFNMLRSVLEKIRSFLGQESFVWFVDKDEKEKCARVINLRSHADLCSFDLSDLNSEEIEVFDVVLEKLKEKAPFEKSISVPKPK